MWSRHLYFPRGRSDCNETADGPDSFVLFASRIDFGGTDQFLYKYDLGTKKLFPILELNSTSTDVMASDGTYVWVETNHRFARVAIADVRQADSLTNLQWEYSTPPAFDFDILYSFFYDPQSALYWLAGTNLQILNSPSQFLLFNGPNLNSLLPVTDPSVSNLTEEVVCFYQNSEIIIFGLDVLGPGQMRTVLYNKAAQTYTAGPIIPIAGTMSSIKLLRAFPILYIAIVLSASTVELLSTDGLTWTNPALVLSGDIDNTSENVSVATNGNGVAVLGTETSGVNIGGLWFSYDSGQTYQRSVADYSSDMENGSEWIIFYVGGRRFVAVAEMNYLADSLYVAESLDNGQTFTATARIAGEPNTLRIRESRAAILVP